jgi:WD40 repeat protein
MIVSGYADGTIKLWNKNNGDLLRTLPGHDGFIDSVAFDNNNMLASGSWDKTIKLWGFF